MANIELEKLMNPDEVINTGVKKLSIDECQCILNWGLRMYSLGQNQICDIDEIKYGGRLVILDDGSRWEVDEFDRTITELWSNFQKVLVYEDEMYLLDDCEKVSVQEEL